jgi:hypothetical protein
MKPELNREIKELLEIAEQVPNPGEEEIAELLKDLSEAEKFIIAKNLKRGKALILVQVIYDAYRKWRKESFISKREFMTQFHKKFERVIKQSRTYYLLDPAAFDLSDEVMLEARRAIREETARRRNNARKAKREAEKEISGEAKNWFTGEPRDREKKIPPISE